MRAAKPGPERRKWSRLPLAIPVFVRSQDEKGNEFLEFATSLNISAGGMLVALRRILPRSRRVQLEIPSAPVTALSLMPRVSRSLHAKALRNVPAGGFYLLGLKFSRPLLASSGPKGRRRRKVASAL